MGKIRVMLADDHKIMREGLRVLLEREPDIEVVGEAEDGQATVRLAKTLLPDLIIIDVFMPNLNGIEATRRLTAEVPNAKVLALSMYSERRFIISMLKAGASAYLLKDCAAEELVSAIRAVLMGRFYLSLSISNVVIRDYIARPDIDQPDAFSVLSAREREVLQLLAEGKSVRRISEQLSVSPKTIEAHRWKMMEKLNIHSLAELTKYAISEGLTSLGIPPRKG
jgi:two-component system response regulator NreC